MVFDRPHIELFVNRTFTLCDHILVVIYMYILKGRQHPFRVNP